MTGCSVWFQRIGIGSLTSWTLACAPPAPPFAPAEFPVIVDGRGAIQGGVYHLNTGRRIAGALLIVQCKCLARPREVQTDLRGLYRFDDLPAGKYTIQALYGRGDVSKTIVLSATTHATITFAIDPERPAVPVILE